ncbi:type I-U CRISPR-associated helicase/endonuclease Cas3 [Rothia mucilaginosa]|uniref:Type I-U CRISPR-associated helicase/endonuclease Cas3 n=1 Tax=Rothia mucilaginosa TaxID=43675 RepID=A0A291DDL2_9MICC|nr:MULTISPECIES: type I-U CRISPR-associated helicase/endonuclease Cas3 [Rothia]ATF62497.1 type I-U CRISPR-associated helicase/endonuclease Cas3 [Rothia mucilaginosa]OFM25480.1 type I-U CRISPR-associated helicase/endonuclease Cas3 [Rothia sp. HMSC069D01]
MTSPATKLPSITRDEFGEFFASLNGGYAPFSWQEEVLDHICEHGVWPERINAPTGSGKSSVVDIHLFANALTAVGAAPRVPRRLCVTVGRRALVDSQATRADMILDCLKKALTDESAEQDILRRVAEALQSFQTRNDEKGRAPFEVGHIRGELSNRTLPVTDISACAIIAATPDMYGSRALFRGYGSTKAARPRETALLAMDTVMVLDEAHMNRQLLHTTQRIAELQKREVNLGIPTLQVVETTATPSTEDSESTTLGVDIEALDSPNDKELRKRVHSHKELVLRPIDKWDGKPGNAATVNAAVDAIKDFLAHREAGEDSKEAHTVGCIVNHVRTAISIKEALAKDLAKDEVQLLVGRMRPSDLEKLQNKHRELFTTEGDKSVKVVVATQTLEVGIDVDFADLVTELAPASSLAQRFGRVNRLGHRTDSKVVVIRPASGDLVKKDAPPYKAVDLSNAYGWLEALNGTENPSVNPAAMVKNPPVQSSPERLLYQRPERSDLLEFSRTDENPYDEPDLDLWLHDSLDAETAMGGVIVRDNLPSNTSAAMEILKTGYFAPRDEETFPANLKILKEILDYQDEHGVKPRKFLYRQGEISLWQDADQGEESSQTLTPGDVLILDTGTIPFTNQGIAVTQRELPSKKDELEAVPFPEGIKLYVYEKCTDREKHFREYLGLSPEEAVELLDTQAPDGQKVIASELTTEAEDGQEVISWYAKVTNATEKKSVEGSDIAQELVLAGPVLLDDHQNDVAERTRQLAENLGLAPEFSEALELAAKYHDEGKRDLRFQQMLGADAETGALAKSGRRSVAEAYRARSRSALPRGWRHEQLSALMVAASPEKVGEHRDLVLRIIGCSHGHGRFSFAHDAGFLLKEGYLPEGMDYEALKEQATRLFNVGYWDNLMEQTSRTYGPYATAYLEAVERAADAQISREGH